MSSSPEIHPTRNGLHLSISPVPVKDLAGISADWRAKIDPTTFCSYGAEICFEGVVRSSENGKRISGIEYSDYHSMALIELKGVADQGCSLFGNHPLFVHHVIGFVKEGEPSITIRVCLPHSKEAFSACQWYLAAVKERVPIWKRPIFS